MPFGDIRVSSEGDRQSLDLQHDALLGASVDRAPFPRRNNVAALLRELGWLERTL